MKTPDKQIISMLQAFDQAAVLKALELYVSGIEDNNKKTKEELKADGWSPQKEKPADREFYLFENEYWVQSQEMRDKQIKEQIEAMNQNKKEASKKYTGQKMDLSKVKIKCPECNGGMYKQSVCGGCAEGKQGYKIRLICEENPDHEFLL
jgi:hypothetical protein